MQTVCRIVVCIGIICSSVDVQAENETTASVFTPPQGKTYFFVGQDRQTIRQYVKATQDIPAGVMVYTSIQKMEGLDQPADCGSGWQDGNALLKTYPDSAIQIGLYMVHALDDVLNETYDQNIKKLARWIKKARRPVFLRIGYEFDYEQNGYEPEKYKAVFKRIVTLIRREGVTNVQFVWHTYTQEEGRRPWMDWYPGDNFVDWFGVSIFSGNQIISALHFRELARDHHKPFMIAESSPMGLYILQSKLNWFKDIFKFIEEQNVDMFCYINSNWDALPMFKKESWGDARVEVNAQIKEYWLSKIKEPRYIKASKNLFKKVD